MRIEIAFVRADPYAARQGARTERGVEARLNSKITLRYVTLRSDRVTERVTTTAAASVSFLFRRLGSRRYRRRQFLSRGRPQSAVRSDCWYEYEYIASC